MAKRALHKYSKAVQLSVSQGTEKRKEELVSTSQGALNKLYLFSDQVRAQTRKLSEFKNIIDQLDRGDLYEYAQFYQYMLDNDSVIASICSTRRDRVISAAWEVKPPDDATDPDSELAAKLCEHCLKELPNWYQIRYALTEAIVLGFSANEISWGFKKDLFIPTAIERRNPNRFIYSPTWELRLSDRYSRGGLNGEQLLEDKWVVHVSSEREGTPNFYGLIRTLGSCFIKRAWVDQFQMHYLEKFGQPHIHAKCGDNASLAVMNEVQAIIDRGSYDHNIVTKGDTTLEFLNASSTQTIDGFERYLQQSEKAITQYVLGTSDLNQAGAVGNLSAVQQRTESVADPKRNRDMMNLAATIQRYLFIPIIKFNSHLFANKPALPLYREIYGDEKVTAQGVSTETGQQIGALQTQPMQKASYTGDTPQRGIGTPRDSASAYSREIYTESAPGIDNPFQIEAREAVKSFRVTDTFKDKLFDAFIKDLRARGVSEKAISEVRAELQKLTLDAVRKGVSAAEVAKSIIDSTLMKSVGVDPTKLGYFEQAAQLNADMAYSGAKWDQVTDLAEETGKTYYWQYHSLQDGNVRPEHVALNGAVFVVGNEDTDRLLPPVDFGCRCYWDMLEEVPDGATLYETVPPEFEDAINPEFSW